MLLTDGSLDGEHFTLQLAEQLRFAGPWGQAFPEPVFDGVFVVDDWRVLGDAHRRMNLRCENQPNAIEAVMFNAGISAPPQRMRAAYSLDVNEWNGSRRLQLKLHHIEPA